MIKKEGSEMLYDPEGFDAYDALRRYHNLKGRWFKTKKVRAEMDDLSSAILLDSRSKLWDGIIK